MITITEARKEAEILTNKKPSFSALRNWIAQKNISGPVDYIAKGKNQGRKGIYPDILPIEIAVTIKLKSKYSMKLIAEVRKEVLEITSKTDGSLLKAKENSSVNVDLEMLKLKNIQDIQKSFEKIDPVNIPGDKLEEMEAEGIDINNLKKATDRTMELQRKQNLIDEFINTWLEFESKYSIKEVKKC